MITMCSGYLSLCTIFFLVAIPFLWFWHKRSGTRNRRGKNIDLPPSPPWGLPIIGHLHLFREPLHRSLAAISHRYGPVLLFRLGFRPVLLVSSPEAAEECLRTNDIAFADRPCLLAGKYLGFDYTAISFTSYGPHWRNLRRLSTLHMFSLTSITCSAHSRREELRSFIRGVLEESPSPSPRPFKKVSLKPRFFNLAYGIMMRTLLGKGAEEVLRSDEVTRRFYEILHESFGLAGETFLGDFVSLFRLLDVSRYEKRLAAARDKGEVFLQELIQKQRRMLHSEGVVVHSSNGERRKSSCIVDEILTLQKTDPSYYTDEFIMGVIIAMLAAGTDTTAVTMEWAMSLMLNHPESLQAAQKELDAVVGTGRPVNDSDLSRLPYLQAVVNETLRLYPPGPILLPHEASSDCIVGGYDIPCGTMLIVNAWAIHRDHNVWEEPDMFMPERFLCTGEPTGNDGAGAGYRLIPFGSGRRRCPGEGLARRTVGLALAAMIQGFQWQRVGFEKVDMSEGRSLTLPKAVPLEAMCRPRGEALQGALRTLLN